MRSKISSSPCLVLLAAALLFQGVAYAQEPDIDWKAGPGSYELGRKVAMVSLSQDYVFAGPKDTKKIMEMLGNPPSGQEAGLVMPVDENKHWFIVFEYNPVGYVTDDDSHEIDADAILKDVRAGTEHANRIRRKQGFSALEVVGWFERPAYDPRTNNLVWAIEARDENGERSVNYNTRLLGRSGYMSATLVTDPTTLAADKAGVEAVLEGFSYRHGQRYLDYVAGDKLAGYGVAALVAGGAGVAAAKVGLFAALGKLFGKLWKLIIIAVAGIGASLRRLFSKGDTSGAY
jgi:uncharacterized membrane-anchored protein